MRTYCLEETEIVYVSYCTFWLRSDKNLFIINEYFSQANKRRGQNLLQWRFLAGADCKESSASAKLVTVEVDSGE